MFDDSWRDFCEDGSEYGIDPEDYETEEEYMEALEEAQEEYMDEEDSDDDDYYIVELETDSEDDENEDWREYCEDGSNYELDPYDFNTEEEYLEALNAAKIEEDSDNALKVFFEWVNGNIEESVCADRKYNWRNNCREDNEYGLDPEDYDTEEEYEDALDDEIEYDSEDDFDDCNDDYDDIDDFDDCDDDYDDTDDFDDSDGDYDDIEDFDE